LPACSASGTFLRSGNCLCSTRRLLPTAVIVATPISPARSGNA
jgi:hypothetical protein